MRSRPDSTRSTGQRLGESAVIEIEGEQVAVDAYGSPAERWVGLGTWREFSGFVHAIDIRPERIRVRVTEQIH